MKGLFVARQAGTVHAFQVLLKNLKGEHRLLNAQDFNPKIAPDFDFICTGTSAEAALDSIIWQWATDNNLPCFAFHDQWVNTQERFAGVKNLPTDILVVDEFAKKLVDEIGLKIPTHVIGSPLWDLVPEIISSRTSVQKDLVVFASEPATLPNYKSENGFDDLDCLQMAIEAIRDSSLQMEILLHPIDQASRLEKFLSPQVKISTKNKNQVLSSAQYIFGMRSMLLVEASIAGIPVVSFQPRRKTKSPATDRPGVEVVIEPSDFGAALKRALQNKPRFPKKSATELFADFLQTRLG